MSRTKLLNMKWNNCHRIELWEIHEAYMVKVVTLHPDGGGRLIMKKYRDHKESAEKLFEQA
jgi:hypothetical protein